MIPNPLGTENHPEGEGPVNETTPTTTSKRNPRATRQEMERREAAILKMFKTNEELDAYQISKALKISYPQTGTVLNSLMESGKVERAGLRSRRVVYRLPAQKTVAKVIETKTPKQTEAAILPLHLGEKLEVTEIHMTKSDIQVEVKDANETFLFSLVG